MSTKDTYTPSKYITTLTRVLKTKKTEQDAILTPLPHPIPTHTGPPGYIRIS